VSKDWRNWTAIRDGRIPDDWPLIGMLKVDNMVTADGPRHRRLRRLVTLAPTSASVSPWPCSKPPWHFARCSPATRTWLWPASRPRSRPRSPCSPTAPKAYPSV
jgi:hypothetical protein